MTIKTLFMGLLILSSQFATAEDRSEEFPSNWDHLDPDGIIPDEALDNAIDHLSNFGDNYPNKNHMVIIDFSLHSGKKRFFLVDILSGEVTPYNTAHGSGSDSDNNGYAEKFGNNNGSYMSSLGYYRTAETYEGKNGYSLRLDGLSSTNSNARNRAVVVHKASYVNPSASKMGRSQGCPALPTAVSTNVINKIKNGSLIYGWIPGTP